MVEHVAVPESPEPCALHVSTPDCVLQGLPAPAAEHVGPRPASQEQLSSDVELSRRSQRIAGALDVNRARGVLGELKNSLLVALGGA